MIAFSYDAIGRATLAQRGTSGDPDAVSLVQRSYNGLGRLTRETQARLVTFVGKYLLNRQYCQGENWV